jgi:four helix bundle protein
MRFARIKEKGKRMGMVFEDLEAWQAARKTVNLVYKMTRHGELAKDFGLKDQIQRASVSVMTNLAEGFERNGVQETLHFYNIAKASSGEVRSLLYVIEDNFPDLLTHLPEIRSVNAQAASKLTGLITSTRKRQAFTTIATLATLTTVALTYYLLT